MNLKNKAKVADALANKRCVFYKDPQTKMWHFETTIRNEQEIEMIIKLIHEKERRH